MQTMNKCIICWPPPPPPVSQYPSSAEEYVTKQTGDRTECALLRFLSELGVKYDQIRARFPKGGLVKVYAYTPARRARSTVVRMPNGAYMVFSMGPADTLLDRLILFICSNLY